MELYVHTKGGGLELVTGDPQAKVGDVAGRSGVEGLLVWLEEGAEPLDPALSIEGAGMEHRAHVHLSRCRKVETMVKYLDAPDQTRAFPPGTTLRAVLAWATSVPAFNIP